MVSLHWLREKKKEGSIACSRLQHYNQCLAETLGLPEYIYNFSCLNITYEAKSWPDKLLIMQAFIMFYSNVFKFRDLYGFTKMWVKTKSIQVFLGHLFLGSQS